jgi:hypothetical protein
LLENAGSQTADDVDIILVAKTATGHWKQEMPKVAQRPQPPELAGSFGSVSSSLWSPFPESYQPKTRGNADGPFIRRDSPLTARFNVQRIKAQMPVSLSELCFQFDSFDSAASFTIIYTLMATNMRQPETGEIHVKVTE